MSSPQSPTLFPFLQLQMHSKYPPPPRRKFVPQLQIVFKVSLPSLIFFHRSISFISFASVFLTILLADHTSFCQTTTTWQRTRGKQLPEFPVITKESLFCKLVVWHLNKGIEALKLSLNYDSKVCYIEMSSYSPVIQAIWKNFRAQGNLYEGFGVAVGGEVLLQSNNPRNY